MMVFGEELNNSKMHMRIVNQKEKDSAFIESKLIMWINFLVNCYNVADINN